MEELDRALNTITLQEETHKKWMTLQRNFQAVAPILISGFERCKIEEQVTYH
jgi:hypothetical protein